MDEFQSLEFLKLINDAVKNVADSDTRWRLQTIYGMLIGRDILSQLPPQDASGSLRSKLDSLANEAQYEETGFINHDLKRSDVAFFMNIHAQLDHSNRAREVVTVASAFSAAVNAKLKEAQDQYDRTKTMPLLAGVPRLVRDALENSIAIGVEDATRETFAGVVDNLRVSKKARNNMTDVAVRAEAVDLLWECLEQARRTTKTNGGPAHKA